MAKMLKLPFGLRNGKLLHVSEVERGQKCNCVCPSCGEPLVAKKGQVVIPHFSHTNQGCERGLETALHLVAKEILSKAKRIYLPEVIAEFQRSYKEPWLLAEGGYYDIDKVVLEKRIDDFIPDVIIESKGRKLLIEIAVTHLVDENKKSKIEKSGISAIEIQLDLLASDITRDSIAKQILDENIQKYWLVNFKAKRVLASMSQYTKAIPIVERGAAKHVDLCPKQARVWQGKPYANVINDCWYCGYCIRSTSRYVYCSGYANVKTYTDYIQISNE